MVQVGRTPDCSDTNCPITPLSGQGNIEGQLRTLSWVHESSHGQPARGHRLRHAGRTGLGLTEAAARSSYCGGIDDPDVANPKPLAIWAPVDAS